MGVGIEFYRLIFPSRLMQIMAPGFCFFSGNPYGRLFKYQFHITLTSSQASLCPACVWPAIMEWYNITGDIRACDFRSPPSTKTGFIVYSTRMFRDLARTVQPNSIVIEIGSSYGVATEILSRRTKHLIGIETSKECVEESRKRYPTIRFEHFDIMGSPRIAIELLNELRESFERDDEVDGPPLMVLFVDIGGNRETEALQKVLAFVEKELSPQVIVCKSQELAKNSGNAKSNEKVDIQAWKREEKSKSEDGDMGNLTRRKRRHPLKQPARCVEIDGEQKYICRYENYDPRGCIKYRDGRDGGLKCDLIHTVCHACLEEGHIALECTNLNAQSLYYYDRAEDDNR